MLTLLHSFEFRKRVMPIAPLLTIKDWVLLVCTAYNFIKLPITLLSLTAPSWPMPSLRATDCETRQILPFTREELIWSWEENPQPSKFMSRCNTCCQLRLSRPRQPTSYHISTPISTFTFYSLTIRLWQEFNHKHAPDQSWSSNPCSQALVHNTRKQNTRIYPNTQIPRHANITYVP